MKVLLIADIGGFPKGYPLLPYPTGFIHAGDEAIFQASYRWYKTRKPQYLLSALTWGRHENKFNVNFHPHFAWPTQRLKNRLYLIKLALKTVLYKYLRLDTFTFSESSFLLFLLKHDRIHFVGGGNINSMFPAWLYYSYLIMFVSRLYGKELVITGQTLGPFKLIDAILGKILINFASVVGVRETTKSSGKTKSMLDTAYFGLAQKHKDKKNLNKTLTIGLSLHEWKGYTRQKIVAYAIKLIKTVSVRYDCQFVFIPHIVSRRQDLGDLGIYREIKKALGDRINLTKKSFKRDFVEAVRKATRSVDLIISSRYHGLVFALSQNVPAINVILDNYYDKKNTALLRMVYGQRAKNYSIDLRKGVTYEETIPKIAYLIDNVALEQSRLTRLNRHLKVNPRISNLDTLLQNEFPAVKGQRYFIFNRLLEFHENA